MASPSISSFSPVFGQPGNVITIRGSGLSTATNVVFNGSAPTLGDFMVISDSQLNVVVPIGATTGPLSVGAATTTSNFSVAPTILSFSPSTGAPATQVYINGANFVSGGTNTLVTFMGAAPVNGTVTASTVVEAAVPAGTVTGPISVTTSAGTTASTNNFIASTVPLITGFSPTVGTTGTSVTIMGNNFSNLSSVQFGGVASVNPIITSTTEISCKVPAGAASGQITVITSGGTATSGSNFLAGTGAIITDFNPTFGGGGTVVTIDGLNLDPYTGVTVNGHAVASITGASANQLQVAVSVGAGSGQIEVLTASGNFATSSNFTYTTAPIVSDFSPFSAGAGTNIVIDGINFSSPSTVKFGGVAATSVTVSANTQINAKVPAGAVSGPITVSLSSGSYTTSSNFFVTTTAPVVTGFTPASAVRGTVVTINGGNFTNLSAPGVEFNGVGGTYLTPTSTTVLYGTVPAGASSGIISVKNNVGLGSSTNLLYLQPWVTNATAAGVVGSAVTLDGSNLTNATTVRINNVNYSFTNSPNRIVATVPANATPGQIVVTTPGGIFIYPNSFVVLPQIFSFTPAIGPAGTVVTIGGTSLFDVTSVQFNGVSATPFNITSNQLQVTVPTGATPGPITLLVPGGSAVSTNNFTATFSSTVNLTKTVHPTVTGPGSNVVYTLTVTNLGPSAITSVTVTDNIPTGFILISASSSMGTTLYTNSMLIASLGTLATNASATITVTGTSSNAVALTNTANLGFAEGDTVFGSDFAYTYAYFVTDAQKTLAIAETNVPGEFLITWPLSAAPFVLQVSTNLSRAQGWQTPTNATFITNGMNAYTNPFPLPAAEFFRLQGP